MQSAYIIFKMFSLRLKINLRKPDVLNLLALKLEYAMSVYQKFRDRMIFARARVSCSHVHRAWQISFSPSALQMFRFSMGS